MTSRTKTILANFYPRSPCGERHVYRDSAASRQKFLSTLSLRRATCSEPNNRHNPTISIHALLAESDSTVINCNSNFTHFYPRSPCGERLVGLSCFDSVSCISIHALLAESDCGCSGRCRFWAYFYPRSPCGERLDDFEPSNTRKLTFLSTLSLRRATRFKAQVCNFLYYFYPRSPCGERRQKYINRGSNHIISIHALLAESDPGESDQRHSPDISIHALLAESDHPVTVFIRVIEDFYPRSPCGERHMFRHEHCE